MIRYLSLIVLAFGLVPASATAQEVAPLDTSRVYELERIVVTADRSASLLATSTAAVSVVPAAEVERLPVVTLADVLHQTPGFAFLSLDGLGYDPQATVRGFYGGGEAEYVVVLLDGRPLNTMEQGLVNWNQIPLTGIQSVEVMRGAASSLYGDAAIGGVINVVTNPVTDTVTRLSLAGGSYGSFVGDAAVQGTWKNRPISVFGDLQRTDGFRDHAERLQGTAGASVGLFRTPDYRLTLSTLHHWRDFDSPGPLTQSELDASRSQGDPVYRFDNTQERTHRLAVDSRSTLGSAVHLSGTITGELRHVDLIRTLPLGFGFFDTKQREVNTRRLMASTQLVVDPLPLALASKLTLGVDASVGGLDTRYFQIVSGDVSVYQEATGARGMLDTQGDAARSMVAAFAQVDVHPVPRLRVTLGGRMDWLRDTFDPDPPSEGDNSDATHVAFSPKAGLNLRYLATARHVGNVYANVSRTFKAPTLDQLYDQRRLPVPFPPFSVSIANADLDPQHGVGVEAGLYHRAELAPGTLAGELSLALYQIDMTDELDFNIETFQFVNIAESRHRGVETGLKLYVRDRVTLFGNYTLQNVTAQYGAFEGNYVKAIPRDFISGGVSASHRSGLSGSVTVTSARRMFLDDANTIELPDYTTVNAKVGYRLQAFALTLDVFNVLDEVYSTTGFPDPASADIVYLYPAAGRTLRLGVGVTL